MTVDAKRTVKRLVVAAAAVALVGAVAVVMRSVPASAETVAASGTGRTTGGTPNAVADTASSGSPRLVGLDYRFPIRLTPAEWKARLTPFQYFILRERGTEYPFTGKYWNNHAAGTYYSAATGQPLFSSKDKYDSGTGWPSFTAPISPNAVKLRVDDSDGMQRIEVVDSLSGSHLGHLFNDGPPPTYKRYCIDSAALIFVPTGGTPPKELTPQSAR